MPQAGPQHAHPMPAEDAAGSSGVAAALDFFTALWAILLETGPWLLVGFAVAGVLHAALPTDWVSRRFGRKGIGSVIGASLIGAPLPLCSCSVIPTAAQFRRAGASKGSAAAFAITTPEIDLPAASLTWALMGWPIAVARIVGALASGIVAGVAIDQQTTDTPPAQPATTNHSCCCTPKPPNPTLLERVRTALRYAYWDLPKDLAGSMSIGLILAALFAAFLPTEWLTSYAQGWPAMFVMLLIGIPFYVCAASTTPLAAVLVAKGLDPGAAIVFLLACPATNPATIAWVSKDLGFRAITPYLVSISVVALAAGYTVSALDISITPFDASVHEHDHTSMLPVWLATPTAIALSAVLTAPLAVSVVKRVAGKPRHDHDCCHSDHPAEPSSPPLMSLNVISAPDSKP